jgi:hypothetical protein
MLLVVHVTKLQQRIAVIVLRAFAAAQMRRRAFGCALHDRSMEKR